MALDRATCAAAALIACLQTTAIASALAECAVGRWVVTAPMYGITNSMEIREANGRLVIVGNWGAPLVNSRVNGNSFSVQNSNQFGSSTYRGTCSGSTLSGSWTNTLGGGGTFTGTLVAPGKRTAAVAPDKPAASKKDSSAVDATRKAPGPPAVKDDTPPKRSAHCRDAAGNAGKPDFANCQNAHASLHAARLIRDKLPQLAAAEYKKAAQAARSAGDTEFEIAILREATEALGQAATISVPEQANAVTPNDRIALQESSSAVPSARDREPVPSAGADCSEVKARIDWVLDDSDARTVYEQQRRDGKSNLEAVVAALSRNPRAQALLGRCQAAAEAHLVFRLAARGQ